MIEALLAVAASPRLMRAKVESVAHIRSAR
jgi:hypothetical protein